MVFPLRSLPASIHSVHPALAAGLYHPQTLPLPHRSANDLAAFEAITGLPQLSVQPESAWRCPTAPEVGSWPTAPPPPRKHRPLGGIPELLLSKPQGPSASSLADTLSPFILAVWLSCVTLSVRDTASGPRARQASIGRLALPHVSFVTGAHP